MSHSMTFFVVGMALTAESRHSVQYERERRADAPADPSTDIAVGKVSEPDRFHAHSRRGFEPVPTFFGLAALGARPWFPLVHTISIAMLCVFCAAAVVCTYGLVIKFLDRGEVDNFAAWSQVGMLFCSSEAIKLCRVWCSASKG